MREELFFSWQHTLKESNGTSMCLFVKSWIYIQSWNCYVENPIKHVDEILNDWKNILTYT